MLASRLPSATPPVSESAWTSRGVIHAPPHVLACRTPGRNCPAVSLSAGTTFAGRFGRGGRRGGIAAGRPTGRGGDPDTSFAALSIRPSRARVAGICWYPSVAREVVPSLTRDPAVIVLQKPPRMDEIFRTVVSETDRYTLADSSSGAIDCFRYAFRRLGLAAASDDEIRDTIGLSLADAFRQLVDPRHWTDAGQFALHFRHRADQVVAARTVLYVSVPNVLQVL